MSTGAVVDLAFGIAQISRQRTSQRTCQQWSDTRRKTKKQLTEDFEHYGIPVYNFPYDIKEDDMDSVEQNAELRGCLILLRSSPPNLQQQKSQMCVVDTPLVSMAAFMADSKQRQERRKADEALAHAGPPGVPMARMGVQRTKAQAVPKTSPYVPQPPTNPMNRLKEQAQISQHPGSPKEARGPQQKFPPNPLNENTIDIMDTLNRHTKETRITLTTPDGNDSSLGKTYARGPIPRKLKIKILNPTNKAVDSLTIKLNAELARLKDSGIEVTKKHIAADIMKKAIQAHKMLFARETPIMWVLTEGESTKMGFSQSSQNERELQVAIKLCQQHVKQGIEAKDMVILAGYIAQANLTKRALALTPELHDVDSGTIDGY
ncbi:MAG: hypothetical protein Q9175_003125 [Cornicularia normoerica]